jgi:CBS domain-containing protein
VAATVAAQQVGRWFCYALATGGIALALVGVPVSGLWLVLIAWFMLAAGRSEAEATVELDVLAGLRVRDLMTRHPEVVAATSTVDEVVHDHVLGSPHSAFPIVDRVGRPMGMITLDGIRAVPPHERSTVRAEAAGTPVRAIPCLSPDAPVRAALEAVATSPTRRALVTTDGLVVGIVSQSDVSRIVERRLLERSASGRLAAGTSTAAPLSGRAPR